MTVGGLLWALGAVASIAPSRAEAQDLSPEIRAAILLRAVAYERGFAGQDGPVTVLVVGGDSGATAADARAITAALTGLSRRVRVAGRPIRVQSVVHRSTANTLAIVRADQADVIYVAPGLSGVVRELGGPLGSAGQMLICADPSEVGRGCLMSVEPNGGSARIVIHLRLALAAGFRFDARLLQLARVIR